MDIKEQAHKYLVDKSCLSVTQTYTAFQVERMLTEFAQEQVKLFCQHDVSEMLPLDFIKWYSGMEEEQVKRAYERWKIESGNLR